MDKMRNNPLVKEEITYVWRKTEYSGGSTIFSTFFILGLIFIIIIISNLYGTKHIDYNNIPVYMFAIVMAYLLWCVGSYFLPLATCTIRVSLSKIIIKQSEFFPFFNPSHILKISDIKKIVVYPGFLVIFLPNKNRKLWINGILKTDYKKLLSLFLHMGIPIFNSLQSSDERNNTQLSPITVMDL